MKPRDAAALALAGWHMMVPPAFDFRSADVVKPLFEVAGGPTFPSSEEEQHLRDLRAQVNAVIAKYFHMKRGEREGEADRWYYGSKYLRHVIDVTCAGKFSPDNTTAPFKEIGYQIGVGVDDFANIGEVKRQLPSQLDGFSIVFGAPVALKGR